MVNFKKLWVGFVAVTVMAVLFGCSSENAGKVDESVAFSSVVETEKPEAPTSFDEKKTESTEASKELVMPTDEKGNAVEIFTMPDTESNENATVGTEAVKETATEVFEETQQATEENEQETQKGTVIELPFIPAD